MTQIDELAKLLLDTKPEHPKSHTLQTPKKPDEKDKLKAVKQRKAARQAKEK